MDDDQEEDSGPRIAEWVVTFGDMMSLLLTFFIMLVSLSEIKEEDKYQALVNSLRQHFGHVQTIESPTPGPTRPHTTAFRVLATVGRAKQKDLARGGVPEPAPHGEEDRVRVVRPGRQTAVGSVVFFESGSAALTPAAREVLDQTAELLRGKPQKVEIRGHCGPELAARATDASQPMDMAYARSRTVLRYLIDQHGIDPQRFRLSSAGDHEPLSGETDAGPLRRNPRVEVFLLDETREDARGARQERTPETSP